MGSNTRSANEVREWRRGTRTRSTTERNGWRRNQNTVKYQREHGSKFGPVTHTIFLAVTVMVLGLIYLTQAAKITSYDYQAQEIDEEIAILESKKQDLEIENARLTALSQVANSEVAREMTQPANKDTVTE